MSVIEVDFELQKPHPAQQQILDTAKRFNHLRCGRRFGKTSLIEELSSISLEGKLVGIWFPTYKDLSEVWKEIKRTYTVVTKKRNEQLHQIELVTNGLIDFWSMEDPDSGQGRKYHRVIIDEAAKAPKLYQAWENTIRPTLTDYRGDAFILSRPKGKNNGFYLLEEKHRPFDNWAFFHYTTYDNPHIITAEVDEAKLQLDDINFRQEYLAEYVDANDRPFLYEFKEEKHVVNEFTPNPHLPLLFSWDFNREPMTCLVCQQTEIDTIYIFDELDLDGAVADVCDIILSKYQPWIYNMLITGDASGRQRSVLTRGNLNAYLLIKQMLMLRDNEIQVPTQNLALSDSRVLCNSVLKHANVFLTQNCKKTIKDCLMAMVDDEGDLIKNGAHPLHKFDGYRYAIAWAFKDFIRRPDKYRLVV